MVSLVEGSTSSSCKKSKAAFQQAKFATSFAAQPSTLSGIKPQVKINTSPTSKKLSTKSNDLPPKVLDC